MFSYYSLIWHLYFASMLSNQVACLAASNSPHPGSLPGLGKMNSFVSLRMDPLKLCYGYIPLSNSTDKLPSMSFEGYHIITDLILSCSNCPLVPAHMSSHPALCSLCSLELLHTTSVAILVRVKHLHNSIQGTRGSITTSYSFIPVSYQSIIAWLGPSGLLGVHSRKGSDRTVDKLVPKLLTNLTEDLGSYNLGTLPRCLSI